MLKKIPDNVVYNETQERYDAFLKPYSTNVGAPAIQVETINSKFE